MKILVFSDSHASLSFMRRCVEAVKPDMLIHLGDYYDDGALIHMEYPQIPFRQVPGNCDRYRTPPHAQDISIDRLFDVDLRPLSLSSRRHGDHGDPGQRSETLHDPRPPALCKTGHWHAPGRCQKGRGPGRSLRPHPHPRLPPGSGRSLGLKSRQLRRQRQCRHHRGGKQ